MKVRNLLLLGAGLMTALTCITAFIVASGTYIQTHESPFVDPLIGRWRIVWDAGTANEEVLIVRLDRISLRQWEAFVARDGLVFFVDDEGCEHMGEIASGGARATGYYTGCYKYPEWVGEWEMVRLGK
jgi:hypothetical protein